jgi:uncharacterized membrane protein YfcA
MLRGVEILPVLLAVLLVAGFTQGATGFGFGLLAMCVLPLLMDVTEAVPLVSVFGLVVCLFILWRYRRHADPRKFLPVLAGEVVGTPFGVLFLTTVDSRIVTGVLGVILVIYGTLSLIAERRRPVGMQASPKPALSRRWGPVAGLLGGLIGGAFNTGGPPVIVYALARRWSPSAFKANLQVVFVFNTIIQLCMFTASGLLTLETLRLNAIGLPVLLAGLAAGVILSRRMDAVWFRRVVLALLVVFGIAFLVRSF